MLQQAQKFQSQNNIERHQFQAQTANQMSSINGNAHYCNNMTREAAFSVFLKKSLPVLKVDSEVGEAVECGNCWQREGALPASFPLSCFLLFSSVCIA
uniref:Uncharacterized protein n=1 Tax=Arundo donax TaxID=35708 RepID=A0A0A9AVX3_ARUDO